MRGVSTFKGKIGMPDAEPFCYPVCKACREAPCPRAFIPSPPKKPYRYPSPNDQRSFLICGCEEELGPLQDGFGPNSKVFCPRHGWKKIRKSSTKKPRKSSLSNSSTSFFDTPPF